MPEPHRILTRHFLSHLYKNFFRSSSIGKDTAVQVALALIVATLAGYSIALGFALERIIRHTLDQNDAITILNGLLIYYLIGGFITRYLAQSLPTLDAQPYLHLPIPRSTIASFLLAKSLLHVINISVFLLFTPFALGTISREYGTKRAWVWLLSLWLLSMINHFLLILIKGRRGQSPAGLFTFIVICALVAGADYFGWIKLSIVSGGLFSTALQGYTIVAILSAVNLFLCYGAYRSFLNRLYPEELSLQRQQYFHSSNWRFLHGFGLIGAWIRVELKLIFRNKRSRELFLMHAAFLLLAFAFYSYIKNQHAYGTFLFLGMICSGFFTMNYGQFLFSWQGSHFEFTLTRPTSIRQFIASKYWLLASTTALWFLFSIPCAFLGWQYLLVNIVASLYNIGINIPIVMNISMWGAKKIDLTHPGSINLEGIGAAQWLMGIPLIASPYLFYLPFSLMGYPLTGLLCVGLAGLIGVVFRKPLIDFTSQRLFNMRHIIASNFRNE